MSSKKFDLKNAGQKTICSSCGTKFYHQKKDIIPCPICGEEIFSERKFFNVEPDSERNLIDEAQDTDILAK